jgi:hypothetical protein
MRFSWDSKQRRAGQWFKLHGGALLVAIVVLAAGCRTEPAVVPDSVDPGWEQRIADNSVEVELIEPFVKLVDLSLLRIGMTKEEVRAVFPDPFEVDLRADDEIWYYGFAELLFRGNYLRDWFNL